MSARPGPWVGGVLVAVVLAAGCRGACAPPEPPPRRDPTIAAMLERLDAMGPPPTPPVPDAAPAPLPPIEVPLQPRIPAEALRHGRPRLDLPPPPPPAPDRPPEDADPLVRLQRACAQLYARCDGRTYRTDVCVDRLPRCKLPVPWRDDPWPCCPEPCIEAYKARRRAEVPVPEAAEATLLAAHPACLQALAAQLPPPAPAPDAAAGPADAQATPQADAP